MLRSNGVVWQSYYHGSTRPHFGLHMDAALMLLHKHQTDGVAAIAPKHQLRGQTCIGTGQLEMVRVIAR